MSHGPSTLGIITTSSLSPISGIRRRKSSRTHGLSRLLTRVHSAVSPRSVFLARVISPSRAASFRSAGIASSRLPSRTSVFPSMSGTLETIFSLLASRKWIIRAGLTGISRGGSGASSASGWVNWRGFRIRGSLFGQTGGLHRPLAVEVELEPNELVLPEAEHDRARGLDGHASVLCERHLAHEQHDLVARVDPILELGPIALVGSEPVPPCLDVALQALVDGWLRQVLRPDHLG